MNDEMNRLEERPDENETPGGLGTVRFLIKCNGDSTEVLKTARKTLTVALQLTEKLKFDSIVWEEELPAYFVDNCIPHPSAEEIEEYLAKPLETKLEEQEKDKWSVEMFMNSFLPELDSRFWEWWDGVVLDDNYVAVAVQVSEWPFPWQAIRWLFIGSGALEVTPEE